MPLPSHVQTTTSYHGRTLRELLLVFSCTMVKTLKDLFNQPETMWLQFRRRLDKLQPYCRIAGHNSDEVREILVALEKVYRETFPQLNLHQWSGTVYTWLTQSLLDPTNSGRVVMDYLMKLVTTALVQAVISPIRVGSSASRQLLL